MRTLNIPDGNPANTNFNLPAAIKFRQIPNNSATPTSQNAALGNALLTGAIQALDIVLIERMEKVNTADNPGWRVWYV